MAAWNSRGRLVRRGSSWQVDIFVNGKRHRRQHPNKKTAVGHLQWCRSCQRPMKKVEDPTVSQCWKYYLRRLSKEGKPSSLYAAERIRLKWSKLEYKRVSNLRQDEVDAIIDSWKVAATTKNTAIKVLRACLRRGLKDGLVENVPIHLRERKFTKPLPTILTGSEMRQLFSAAPDPRARAIIGLGVYAGLRRAEIVSLTLDNVDIHQRIVSVTAKGDFIPKTWEERAVPVADQLLQYLKDHIALLPPRRPWEEEANVPRWLFPSTHKRGHHTTTHRAWGIITEVSKAAGVATKGMHVLRRTWATNVLRTASLSVVMRLGGWQNLKTVQVYIGTDTDAARAAIDSLEF